MKLELAGGAGRTILEYDTPVLLSTIFARQGIPVEMPCGGRQRCLKCRVKASGELSPLTQRERELLTPEEIAAGVRQPWEFRVRFLGETKEQAKAACIAETSPTNDGLDS